MAKKFETYRRSFEQNRPYSLLRLTLACNARCLFCNVPAESYRLTEMSYRNVCRQVDTLCCAKSDLRLDLTGGEPTLRPDLVRIVAYAAKRGVKVIQLQTNGILLSRRRYVRELKDAGLDKAFVALHSSREDEHDLLVGQKGAFKKCIRAIDHLLESGIEVVLNPVVTSLNIKNLHNYVEFLARSFPGIKSLSLSVVQPRGRVRKNDYLVPRYGLIDRPVKEFLTCASRLGLRVFNPYCGLPFCVGGWYEYLDRCVEFSENILRLKNGYGFQERFSGKVKAPQCRLCVFKNYCNGIWEEYGALYGFDDLRPMKKRRLVDFRAEPEKGKRSW